MSDTTFAVSPNVSPGKLHETVDYIQELRTAFRRPIEATWLPRNLMVACDQDNALLKALVKAFYSHLPLRLSPDVIWITIAHGFALHVNQHAEELRHRFVQHSDKVKLTVNRPDFFPGQDNPWPEAFAAFGDQLSAHTGGLTSLLEADFSTTGPVERAVSHLLSMETFKAYFEYEILAGCGIPSITLTGTIADWQRLRAKAQRFAEYGLTEWIETLDPVLAQFELAKAGTVDVEFWQSIFRYHSGSGPAVLTGWANVLFPNLKRYADDSLYPNPYLKDWKKRFDIDKSQHWRDSWDNPQGTGLTAYPACHTAVPLKVFWGDQETEMRLVGGLMGVTQEHETLTIEAECGWIVLYEEPLDPLTENQQMHEDRKQGWKQAKK